MNRTLSSVSLGFVALLTSACAVEGNESSSEQDIKGKNKMVATQRDLKQVSVFDQDGVLQGVMTGAGLTFPFGAHIEGDDVYVVNQDTNSVFAHIHEQGENGKERWELKKLIPRAGETSGLVVPFYPTVKDGVLYVSSQNSNAGAGEVFRYDALTGEPQGASLKASILNGPRGLDFDSAGNLYVAGFRSHNIVKFDANGNASAFGSLPVGTSPCGVSINSADQVCIGSAGGKGVFCFEGDGTPIYGNAATTGQVVCGVDFGRDGLLYATRPPLNLVETHDIATGTVAPFVSVTKVAGVSWGTHSND